MKMKFKYNKIIYLKKETFSLIRIIDDLYNLIIFKMIYQSKSYEIK